MLKKIIAAGLLLCSTSALSNTCLKQASNADLMNELNNRLSFNNTPSSESAIVNFYCNSGDLFSEVWNSGEKVSSLDHGYFGSKCEAEKNRVAGLLKAVTTSKAFALCRSGDLLKYTVTSQDIFGVSSTYLGAKCDETATNFNKLMLQ